PLNPNPFPLFFSSSLLKTRLSHFLCLSLSLYKFLYQNLFFLQGCHTLRNPHLSQRAKEEKSGQIKNPFSILENKSNPNFAFLFLKFRIRETVLGCCCSIWKTTKEISRRLGRTRIP
ncbi:LOW QUALITY PROTEIN: hypothetical protein TorRG33x02_218460, partial [Trema orientale]